MSRHKNHVGQDVKSLVREFRKRWSRARIGLLLCHLVHAIDETIGFGGEGEEADMQEAEKMLLELKKDLFKLIPEKRCKFRANNIDELLTEEPQEEEEG